MTDPAATRPRQVTFAGWMIVVGSAVVVFSAFERMSGLHTLETQEAVRDFLGTPPGDGLGLSVDQTLDMLRWMALVAGGVGTAAAILGVYALRRSTTARLVLTVLALPMLVAGMAVGGLVSSLVVAASLMLWVSPAREWFRGERRPAAVGVPDRSAVWERGPAPPASDPPPPSPFADAGQGDMRPAAETGFGQPRPAPAPGDPSARTPGPVIAACIVTWIATGLIAALLGITALVLASSPDMLFDEVQRQNPELLDQGVDRDSIRLASLVLAGVIVPWCIAAAVLAVLVVRRVGWARVALMVSSGVAGALSLLAMVGSVAAVVPLLASAAVLALLSRSDTKQWFASRTPGSR